jgi:hypothetical protein
MTEKKFKYTAKIKQPQTAAEVKLDPKGGFLSEREIKTVKNDAYGASLLEKGLLVVAEKPATAAELSATAAPAAPPAAAGGGAGDTVPDFDERGFKPK